MYLPLYQIVRQDFVRQAFQPDMYYPDLIDAGRCDASTVRMDRGTSASGSTLAVACAGCNN